jgi:hypothetical protein
MHHVDQALCAPLDLKGGTKRSALKAAFIGMALAALAGSGVVTLTDGGRTEANAVS